VAKVSLSTNLRPFTGGETEIDLDVATVQQLFRMLGRRYPLLEPHLENELAVAIDGEIFQDALLQPIASDSVVHLFPKIAGG